MCKYIHIRKITEGKIQGKGGATIAYEALPNGGFLYATALCHHKDNFNKHLGRVKAAGRLKSFHYATLSPEEQTEKDFIASMIKKYS